MAERNDSDYDELEARLTDPSVPLRPPASALTGAAAARYGRDFLLREYGSEDAIADAMRPGRPTVGSTKRGPSPVVRGVVPQNEFDALDLLGKRTGKRQSELVRRAVHELLVAERLVI